MTKIESEKLVERKLREAIKERGGLCIKLQADFFVGLPDRLCLIPVGRVVFVELKTTKQKPRKLQIITHNKLRALGFRVEVIDSTEQVDNFINSIENGKQG